MDTYKQIRSNVRNIQEVCIELGARLSNEEEEEENNERITGLMAQIKSDITISQSLLPGAEAKPEEPEINIGDLRTYIMRVAQLLEVFDSALQRAFATDTTLSGEDREYYFSAINFFWKKTMKHYRQEQKTSQDQPQEI